jgi:hypothetical protein
MKPNKAKDSYAAILKETRATVKQIAALQKNVKKILARMDEAHDKAEVKRIRGKL